MDNLDKGLLFLEVEAKLSKYFGDVDKSVVDCLINVGQTCTNVREFNELLKHRGLEVPLNLTTSVFNAIRRLIPPSHNNLLDETSKLGVPELFRIYKGKVTLVQKGCFFVKLDGFSSGITAFVNPLNVRKGLVDDMNEVVKINQEVYAKVVTVLGRCFSLSIKDIDQRTGRDLSFPAQGTERTSLSGIQVDLNDKDPAMLLEKSNFLDVTPAKIFKNPAGSLSLTAAAQAALLEKRREVIDQFGLSLSDHFLHGGTNRLEKVPRKVQRESLPIYKLKDEIVKAVEKNQVVVVIGENGSGKTTQLTQILAGAGYAKHGKIGCTQPRRMAAISAAKRVAEELGCRVGDRVGYSTRHEACIGLNTVIEYVTEGVLLGKISGSDSLIFPFSVVIIDEAHERAIGTDVLLGLMKNIAKHRPSLRLVVVTAVTKDLEKLSGLFPGCSIVAIPLQTFPVEIVYTRRPKMDYLETALLKVSEIHSAEPEGDIILFLTDQNEVDFAYLNLPDSMKSLIVFPVYNPIPREIPSRLFEPAPPGKRKLVIAAAACPEFLLPINGVRYVIDPGFVRLNVHNPKLALDSLVVAPISQETARQRARLAGRTGPGKCYRLYTESAFCNEMNPATVPEVQRINIADNILRVKAMKIEADIFCFEFLDMPSQQALASARRQLYSLEALDEKGFVTFLGRKMAEFPLDPPWSKMLIASSELGCSDEILTIIAMVLARNVFCRPSGKLAEADQRRVEFFHPEGDHLTLLAVYEAWKAHNFSSPWCWDNYVNSRILRKAHNVRKHLYSIMTKQNLSIVSARNDSTKIRKAITAGLFFHAARKDTQESYRTLVENQPVHIHPSSALYQRKPSFVVYNELVVDTKEYMRNITAIDPKWLTELAPRFFKVAGSRITTKTNIEPIFDLNAEPNSWD